MSRTEPINLDTQDAKSCPGCEERDAEIERLLELNRKLASQNGSVKTVYLQMVGGLLLALFAMLSLLLITKAANEQWDWLFWFGIGGLVSLMTIQFGYIPSLLLIGGKSGLIRFMSGIVSVVFMGSAWLGAGILMEDIGGVMDDMINAVWVVPIAIVACIIPMFVVKILGHWKLIQNGDAPQTSSPTIAGFLFFTALIAVAMVCLRQLDTENLGADSTAAMVFLFFYYLFVPGLVVGSLLAASCYAVLGLNRSITKVVLSYIAISIVAMLLVPLLFVVTANWTLGEAAEDPEMWQLITVQGLGPIIVGLVFALPTAIWLRLIGYRLCTRGSSNSVA